MWVAEHGFVGVLLEKLGKGAMNPNFLEEEKALNVQQVRA
jgi:hypothetical protein